jgi:hypothetical protein
MSHRSLMNIRLPALQGRGQQWVAQLIPGIEPSCPLPALASDLSRQTVAVAGRDRPKRSGMRPQL